jgi:hypothetical protein
VQALNCRQYLARPKNRYSQSQLSKHSP